MTNLKTKAEEIVCDLTERDIPNPYSIPKWCPLEENRNIILSHINSIAMIVRKEIYDETQPTVEADRRGRCSVCGVALILTCSKCSKPPVSTTAA